MNAGALEMARIVEQLTPLLISINIRYKAHAGIRTHRAAGRRPLGVKVALLAGGTGGAKLAAGVQDLLGADLAVIANTADDVEVHGLHVSPDPDLVTYWLAGEIDEERGWGIRDDTSVVSERLERLGAPGWFELSDRDLATCLYRTQLRRRGRHADRGAGADRAGARASTAAVLPMCEDRVRTRVRTPAGWRGLQEFLILDRGEAPIEAVEVEGLARGGANAGGARGDRRRRGDRDRPVEPGDLDRPDPLGARACARRSPPRRRRSSPSARSSPDGRSRGRPRRSWRRSAGR